MESALPFEPTVKLSVEPDTESEALLLPTLDVALAEAEEALSSPADASLTAEPAAEPLLWEELATDPWLSLPLTTMTSLVLELPVEPELATISFDPVEDAPAESAKVPEFEPTESPADPELTLLPLELEIADPESTRLPPPLSDSLSDPLGISTLPLEFSAALDSEPAL